MPRPFDSGSQALDWQARNCLHCRQFDAETGKSTCDIDRALLVATIISGQVSEAIARRMGYKPGPPFPLTWDCPEKEEKQP